MTTLPQSGSRARRRPAFGNRVAELGAGLSANAALTYGFDYLLYPYVVYRYGVLQGGAIMALASFTLCLLLIRLYDWSRRDWLGIEAIKELKAGGSCCWARLAAWFLNKSEPVAAVFLSIKFDPFITTLYLRQGAYSGLSARDWRIFLFSLVLGNGYWIAACYLGLMTIDWMLKQVGWIGLF